ncbi:MAG: hypothetical protein M3069_06690 [Chloroflexota bacterium]|nr:hypothetical protein [Chloroflexota bacterium]
MLSVGCGTRHLTLLGTIWSLPNTLIGLGFAVLSGVLPTRMGGLLVARSNAGLANLFLSRRGFGAITFGRVVVSAVPVTPQLLAHESHHSRQYEVLGLFFLPAYLWLHARYGYAANPLECEAEACAASSAGGASGA